LSILAQALLIVNHGVTGRIPGTVRPHLADPVSKARERPSVNCSAGTPTRLSSAEILNSTVQTGRTVDVSIGGDHLKVTGVTSRRQEEIIDAWLAHHASGG
jgi:hypothetical protein